MVHLLAIVIRPASPLTPFSIQKGCHIRQLSRFWVRSCINTIQELFTGSQDVLSQNRFEEWLVKREQALETQMVIHLLCDLKPVTCPL